MEVTKHNNKSTRRTSTQLTNWNLTSTMVIPDATSAQMAPRIRIVSNIPLPFKN